jgi:hypothetical protein
MSDHVDGPRSIGDPAADLTDLFAFTSPADTKRTVIAANVFPSAGTSAMFSNAVDHSLVVRAIGVAGLGDAAGFKTAGNEHRFSVKFGTLEAGRNGGPPVQRGTCTLPDGQTLKFVVNDERGSSTPDGAFRIFAGLRSDPFILAWLVGKLQKFENLLQHDNVLSIVIEFDTRHVLDLNQGSLFGVIAETLPIPQPGGFIGHDVPRIDWVGRPEQTNMRLNNPDLAGTEDLRDLWNQQDPFAIREDLLPVFRKRMTESLKNWDQRNGKADWSETALAANAEVLLNDWMLFDVTKPISDDSFLEIEKSTLNGRAYQTGGGRTVNSNVIDILLNWMVNHDQGEPLRGGATTATQPGSDKFPYLAPPNAQIQTVVGSVDLAASPEKVWETIGTFGAAWHPLIARIQVSGNGVGQLRTMETIDGKQFIEQLQSIDPVQRTYRYRMISGIPTSHYEGTLSVKSKSPGSTVEWRTQYLADGQPDIVIKTIVSTLQKVGFEGLKARFGAAK